MNDLKVDDEVTLIEPHQDLIFGRVYNIVWIRATRIALADTAGKYHSILFRLVKKAKVVDAVEDKL